MSRRRLAPIMTGQNSKPHSHTCAPVTPWWSGGSPGWRDPSNKSSRPPRPRAKETGAQGADTQYRHRHARGTAIFPYHSRFDEFQRELIVENTKAGLAAARKRGRRGARPRVLDKEKTRVAEAMLNDTANYPFVGDVIDHLRIGRTAFYRYFPPAVSENSRISPERPTQPMSFYVPLSKRARTQKSQTLCQNPLPYPPMGLTV
jgi:hypothetical protein